MAYVKESDIQKTYKKIRTDFWNIRDEINSMSDIDTPDQKREKLDKIIKSFQTILEILSNEIDKKQDI